MARTYRNDFGHYLGLRRPRTHNTNRRRLTSNDCWELGIPHKTRYQRLLPTAWDDIPVSSYTEWYYTNEYKYFLSHSNDG